MVSCLVVLLLLPWAAQVRGHPAEPVGVREALFCETQAAFDETGCRWREVRLPHRWQPQGPEPAWALYRLALPPTPHGALGVVAENLSLHGMARMGSEIAEPSALRRVQFPHLRYWPQLFVFQPAAGLVLQPAIVDVAVRGHPQGKSGLGSVVVAPLQVAQEWYLREVLLEVVLVLVMSGASVMAGLVGLFAGGRRSLVDRLLKMASLLAAVAGLRAAMNYVVDPWLPWPAWQALGLWLLAAIGSIAAAALMTYLRPDDRRVGVATAGVLAGLALTLSVAPPPWRFPLAEAAFVVLVLILCALIARVAWVALRRLEPIGLTLVLPVFLIMLSGAHDLALHLGSQSLSDRYVLKWSTPGIFILLIVLLGRRASAQRAVEAALKRETGRRQELLRDLHDGVGSRLVALAFHARQRPEHRVFTEEIDRLIRELQLIQGAVRADPTDMQTLVADLRHLYARVGGGVLPISWEVAELPSPCPLSSEQAVATARILEEAVANVMKHAPEARITVSLMPGREGALAELAIADDGPGRFEEGSGAGLRHMRLRAEHAGLGLVLQQPGPGDVTKAVKLTVPRGEPRAGWLGAWRTGLLASLLASLRPALAKRRGNPPDR